MFGRRGKKSAEYGVDERTVQKIRDDYREEQRRSAEEAAADLGDMGWIMSGRVSKQPPHIGRMPTGELIETLQKNLSVAAGIVDGLAHRRGEGAGVNPELEAIGEALGKAASSSVFEPHEAEASQ